MLSFVVDPPRKESTNLLQGQKDHLIAFLSQTLDEFHLKQKPWLSIIIDICLLVCQDMSYILSKLNSENMMGFPITVLDEGNPMESAYVPFTQVLGGQILLKGVSNPKIVDIMNLALFAVCHLKLEASLLQDLGVRAERRFFKKRSFLDAKRLWDWISKIERKEEDEEASHFDLAVRRLKQTVISVSPNVTFPPPKLLVKLRDQEAQLEQSENYRKSTGVVADEWLSTSPTAENRLSTFSLRSAVSISIDIKTGLDSIVSDSNSMQGLIRHQSIALAYSFSWIGQVDISCSSPRTLIIQYYQKQEPFKDDCLGDYIVDLYRNASKKCIDPSCSKPMFDHVLYYTHKGARISVRMYNVEGKYAPCPDDSIYLWCRCAECDASSSITKISHGTWYYSFGKFLELILYCDRFTPEICCHIGNKYSIERNFRIKDFIVTFAITEIQRFEMSFPRIQINHEYDWNGEIPNIDPIEYARYKLQSEVKMQVYTFYESLKDYLAAVKLWFHFNPELTRSRGDKLCIHDMFEDMITGFNEEEMLIYESICTHDIHKLSNVRREICTRLLSTVDQVTTWHMEYLQRCKVQPDWQLPEFCISKSIHLIPNTSIIIREDEPSSGIAFCLSLFPHILDPDCHEWKEFPGVKFRITRDAKNHSHWKVKVVTDVLQVTCVIYFAEEFDKLRKYCDMDDTYLHSLSRCQNWNVSGGKSKAGFFKTLDDQIVLKELCQRWTIAEKDALMAFTPAYLDYMKQTGDNPTILAKIFGFYNIKMKNLTTGTETNLDVSVMEHLFANKNISRKFDLKGVPDRHIASTSSSGVLLDAEWLQGETKFKIGRYGSLFPLYPHSKRILVESVHNDTDFLSSQNIMDYSLLVGVDDENKELIVGIVDFIGPWTWYKLVETRSKSTMNMHNGKQVTILPPNLYRDRFRKAMNDNFLMVPDKWTKVDVEFGELPSVI